MKNNHFMEFDRDRCNELAQVIFLETSGIRGKSRKAERMQREAMAERRVIDERIKLRAEYVFYDDVEFSGKKAVIGGQALICSAFEQIKGDTVHGAYVYALSAGDFSFPEDTLMNQLYADLWGTAFADAARILLKEELEKKDRLSDSFGPGFYGMKVSEMAKLAELVDIACLDMQLKDSGVLLPLKSCAGIYFCVDEGYTELNEACGSCRGNHQSCRLCNVFEAEQKIKRRC